MHRFHPDPDRPGEDPDALLYDDCQSCDRAATDPVARLDNRNLLHLVDMLVAVELDESDYYHSDNDRRAVDALWPTYLLIQRNPAALERLTQEAIDRRNRATPLTDAINAAQS